MIGVPMTSNSIIISRVRKECCKSEFDSTYPVHLNGIINQVEYQESVARINRSIWSKKLFIINIICIIMSTIIVSLGIIFCVGNQITVGKRRVFTRESVIVLILMVLGATVFFFGSIAIRHRLATQLKKAVVEESTKYSTRSPIPCSWRLETKTIAKKIIDQIVIDIGHPIVSRNAINYPSQDINELQMLYSPQDSSAPSPYRSQSAVICTHCGVSPLDLTAKYCSSCGHALCKQ